MESAGSKKRFDIVTRVLEIVANPESSAEELMKVISADQSLATLILKVSNSAFFGLMRKVSSLEHAVKLLGFNEIQNLVIAKCVFNSFKNLSFFIKL